MRALLYKENQVVDLAAGLPIGSIEQYWCIQLLEHKSFNIKAKTIKDAIERLKKNLNGCFLLSKENGVDHLKEILPADESFQKQWDSAYLLDHAIWVDVYDPFPREQMERIEFKVI